MKDRMKRLSALENRLPSLEALELDEVLFQLFEKFEYVPLPEDFYLAIRNAHQLESLDTDWARKLISNGGKELLFKLKKMRPGIFEES
jgi:hypothetical protein